MKKTLMRFLVLMMLLMLNVTVISNLNIITANASTEVSIENTENKSFFEELKEKIEQRKKDNEKKKQTKEFNKKIKKAKKNLNKKKYNEVLEILNPELDKGIDIDVSEAELLCNMVNYYIGSKEDYNNKMYENAKEKLTAIDVAYEEYKIKEDIDNLRANIEKKLEYKEEINTKIDEVATLINEKKLQSAKSMITELLNKDIVDEQKLRLTELENNIDLIIEEEKKAEAERKRIEEENRKQEELRKQQELKKQQEAANKKANDNSSSLNNKSSNNSTNSGTTGGQTYYIAAGNRYYHKSSTCKFIKGANITATSDISGKFACNCAK